MVTKDDILTMISNRGYKAIYLDIQPHAGVFTFLVFNSDRYHHWSVADWIVNKNDEFVQQQVDIMLYDKFGPHGRNKG